jgi:PIN domain nuclease of toxin-antitoxin system
MILLDTNSLIWQTILPEKLSSAARSAIATSSEAGETLSISIMTLWEIALLVSRRRLLLHVPIERFFDAIEANYRVFPVTRAIAMYAADFQPPFPKDPMDRLIAATALAENLTLITADRNILASNACKLLW